MKTNSNTGDPNGAIGSKQIAGSRDSVPALNIPTQEMDKSHSFCPEFAKAHGESAAVILQGLGYKVAKSKKVRNGQTWHFDTLEELQKRWPYLSESGIHGSIQSQVAKGNITKGKFNKWWADKTTWYSVPKAISARALETKGKFWFDVPVATKCRSVVAGTIYQNIRYHLLSFTAMNPALTDTPYYAVSKSVLSKILPWSLSTIKRSLRMLQNEKLIIENPARRGEFTLANKADLVVPEAMKIAASKGANPYMSGRSIPEKAGSNPEKAGSFVESNGSKQDSNTHCEPLEKTIQKHHSQDAARAVCGVVANAATAAKLVKGIDIPQSIADIRRQITKLRKEFSQEKLNFLEKVYENYAENFYCTESETFLLSKGPIHSSNSKGIVAEVFSLIYSECNDVPKPNLEPLELEYYALISTLKLLNIATDSPAELKTEVLLSLIESSNREGWITSSGDVILALCDPTARSTVVNFFQEDPHFSSDDIVRRLTECIEIAETESEPKSGFDKYFHVRRGRSLKFLLKHWNKIRDEI